MRILILSFLFLSAFLPAQARISPAPTPVPPTAYIEPDPQVTPGPEDRPYGPRLPEGEAGGSNAAIGSALHSIFAIGSLAVLVVVVLIAANN